MKIQTGSFILTRKDWINLIKIEINEQKLNYGEILLLCEIECLTGNENHKYCTASNAYFADTLCTTERNIQKYLKKLKNFKLITSHEDKQGMRTLNRTIYIKYDRIAELILHEQSGTSAEEDKSKEPSANEGHEQMDTSSTKGHEQKGKSTCTNGHKDMNKKVKGHEQMDTLIRKDKKVKEIYNKEDKQIDSYPKTDNLNLSDYTTFPDDLKLQIQNLYKKGYKYNKDNPEIQNEIGMNINGKVIFNLLNDMKSNPVVHIYQQPTLSWTGKDGSILSINTSIVCDEVSLNECSPDDVYSDYIETIIKEGCPEKEAKQWFLDNFNYDISVNK